MYPPGNFGSEFYAGDADRIGAACAAGEWEALRAGVVSVCHVAFPWFVHCTDVLLLPEVLSVVTGRPVDGLAQYGRCVAENPGIWGADVFPRVWTASLADVDYEDVPRLRGCWMETHIREFETEPDLVVHDWMADPMLAATRQLVNLARSAVQSSLEVIEIWKH